MGVEIATGYEPLTPQEPLFRPRLFTIAIRSPIPSRLISEAQHGCWQAGCTDC